MIKTLAIETSCDDTSVGIISFDGKKFEIEYLYSYSQIKEHSQYGGVVPEVASRLHQEKILAVLGQIGLDKIKQVDFITVTGKPGLPGSLIVGKTVANTLGEFLSKKVVEVNHIMGHIFSIFLERNIEDIKFPMVVLTASGGHNEVYIVYGGERSEEDSEEVGREGVNHRQSSNNITDNLKDNHRQFGDDNEQFERESQKIGEFEIVKIGYTLDDAAGEAFDKIARMLGGPYPGGPWISELARKITEDGERSQKRRNNITDDLKDNHRQFGGNREKSLVNIYDLVNKKIKPIFLSSDKYEFSFSGYKSQVWYLLQELERKGVKLTNNLKSYIAWRFQESVVEVLSKKLIKAAIQFNAQTIAIVGGVSANDRLWQYINQLVEKKKQIGILSENVQILRPVKKIYSTDNAAMIGVVGIIQEYGKNKFKIIYF